MTSSAGALGVALAFLNRRERTVAETRARLEHEGLPAAEIEAAVEGLQADGYLDDTRYARLFTEDRRNLDGWGAERIRLSLAARGIEQELIELALREGAGGAGDEQDGRDAELGRALELLRRRFPQPPTERRQRERALGVMLRKGYSADLALDALTAYGAAESRW